ncbi:MAG: hypothetical protein AAF745_08965 [Planctomycetota bacterium]
MTRSFTRTDTADLASVLVIDFKPLSLIATAGLLHHGGWRCVCASNLVAVAKALALVDWPDDAESVTPSSRTSGEANRPSQSIRESSGTTRPVDLVVWDVGDLGPTVIDYLDSIRADDRFRDLPAILIAEPVWAGLEKKTETLIATTHCLFKPVGTTTLISLAEQLRWMPALQATHRARGGKPARVGWVTLD